MLVTQQNNNFTSLFAILNLQCPVLNELVSRSANLCSTQGDEFCDTAADPFVRNYVEGFFEDLWSSFDDLVSKGRAGGVVIRKENCSLTYLGNQRDTNGDLHTPPLDNIMSYYYCCLKVKPSGIVCVT